MQSTTTSTMNHDIHPLRALRSTSASQNSPQARRTNESATTGGTSCWANTTVAPSSDAGQLFEVTSAAPLPSLAIQRPSTQQSNLCLLRAGASSPDQTQQASSTAVKKISPIHPPKENQAQQILKNTQRLDALLQKNNRSRDDPWTLGVWDKPPTQYHSPGGASPYSSRVKPSRYDNSSAQSRSPVVKGNLFGAPKTPISRSTLSNYPTPNVPSPYNLSHRRQKQQQEQAAAAVAGPNSIQLPTTQSRPSHQRSRSVDFTPNHPHYAPPQANNYPMHPGNYAPPPAMQQYPLRGNQFPQQPSYSQQPSHSQYQSRPQQLSYSQQLPHQQPHQQQPQQLPQQPHQPHQQLPQQPHQQPHQQPQQQQFHPNQYHPQYQQAPPHPYTAYPPQMHVMYTTGFVPTQHQKSHPLPPPLHQQQLVHSKKVACAQPQRNEPERHRSSSPPPSSSPPTANASPPPSPSRPAPRRRLSSRLNTPKTFPGNRPRRANLQPATADITADKSDNKRTTNRRNGKNKSSSTQSTGNTRANLKQLLKAFLREFKARERISYEESIAFAKSQLKELPSKLHWKVHLEMADLAKRDNRFQQAIKWYKKVNQLAPEAPQGWLEYAKMQEECGHLDECGKILDKGLLLMTNFNEPLMIKAIKHREKMGQLEYARALLARLRPLPIDKTWKTVLEGALLESRAGNVQVARKIFKYLMENVHWSGPVYQEAFRFEEKCEQPARAIAIVEKGLEMISRYGPLWFSALHIYEKTAPLVESRPRSASSSSDDQPAHRYCRRDLNKVRDIAAKAISSISKELVWKVYFEMAQIEDRAGNFTLARQNYVKAVDAAPDNLLWKVWLGGARTELNAGCYESARKLLTRALNEVPTKMRSCVLLEFARLEEYVRNDEEARSILKTACQETRHEWKVFLESVLLEMRCGHLDNAFERANEALSIHSGTGRLWAVMIQLKQSHPDPQQQISCFHQALSRVPKSGEVWCEGARIALRMKNYTDARKFLHFAIQFTPQYGDSFIEFLRLELLEKGANACLKQVNQLCVNADPNYGLMWLHCKKHPLDSTRSVLRNAKQLLLHEIELAKQDQPGVQSSGRMLSLSNLLSFPTSGEQRKKAIFGSHR